MAEATALTKKINEEFREIIIDRGRYLELSGFPNNFISTGKYNIFNLIPKNLLEQFQRVANIWFLIVSIFQVLPLNLSPTSSWATIAPLSLVLAVTLAKDAYHDFRRHKSDKAINNRLVKVWVEENTEWEYIKWMDLQVGNIILLEQDDPVPADILILTTSHSTEQNCFIETSNLDGEDNLKIRYPPDEICSILNGHTATTAMININHLDEATFKTEQPNNKMHTFDGSLKLKGYPRAISINLNNMILRGSTLKNTKWIIALVAMTGVDTKLMKNSQHPNHKRSNIEKRVNRYLIIVFGMLILIVATCTAISMVYAYAYESRLEFFTGEGSKGTLLNAITFMILFNGLVPISLYVTMDIVRLLQAKFITWDLNMYYIPIDQPAEAKTGDLNEDLGQVEYLFTDKTGTLTENLMEFKMCSIHGQIYGSNEPNTTSMPAQVCQHPRFTFNDPSFLGNLKSSRNREINEFLEVLALCHTVIPDQKESGEIEYQAASPDEEALVLAAHCFGYSYISNKAGSYTLRVNGEIWEYKLLCLNEFTSTRKRMSVIVEPIFDKKRKPVLYCKGADNVIIERCKDSEEAKELLNDHLTEFSMNGFRTLVLAKKELTPEEAEEYEKKFNTAKNALADREERLEALAAELEWDMELIGATAIEDKIQEGVSETISTLLRAGIKICVLTGDKQETAINIGYSCKLLQPEMNVIKLNSKSLQEAKEMLQATLNQTLFDRAFRRTNTFLQTIQYVDASPDLSPLDKTLPQRGRKARYKFVKSEFFIDGSVSPEKVETLNLALVTDGSTLTYILNDTLCMRYFSILMCISHAVICCRVSPLQKSLIVQLVKNHFSFRPLTCAIGDGANDVAMIQEAHVGIGICGREGMQAANSSDYSVARFRFLLPLLLHHGRWNYQRISTVVLYSFYKNFLLILLLFYFSFMNLYSGTSLYDSWLMMGYNVGFTALPIIILGIFDTDLPRQAVLNNPQVYTDGIYSKNFNYKIFIVWTFKAIYKSIIAFIVLWQCSLQSVDKDGNPESLDQMGAAAYYTIVQIVTYTVWSEMKQWSKLFIFVTILSLIAFYPVIFIYDYSGFPTTSLEGVSVHMFSYSSSAFYLFFVPFICGIPRLGVIWWKSLFHPNNVQELQRTSNKIYPSKSYVEDSKFNLIAKRAIQYCDNLNNIFVSKGLKVQRHEDDEREYYALQKYSMQFRNVYVEKSYKMYLIDKIIKFVRIMFWILLTFYTVWNIIDNMSNTYTVAYIVIRCLIWLLLVCVVFFTRTRFFKDNYDNCIVIMIACALTVKFVQEAINQNDGSMSTAVVIVGSFILFKASAYKIFIVNLVALIAYLIRISVTYGSEYQTEAIIIVSSYGVLLLGVFLSCGFIAFSYEITKRMEFVWKRKQEAQYQKGHDILGNLLPNFVKDRVRQGVRYIAESQSMVTVMFCDIYEFDKICAALTPNELLQLLDRFFSMLDQLCEKHGVTKIETVNKTYMACGGLSDIEATMKPSLLELNHAERCVELALDIIKRLEPVSIKTGDKLRVKIGINSGPVIAGVVGDHKPQFSLVGTTVNESSRMCSTLKSPDKIQISAYTHDHFITPGKYKLEPGFVEAKGLGKVQVYVIDKISVRKLTRRPVTFNNMHPHFTKTDTNDGLDITNSDQLEISREPLISEENELNISSYHEEDDDTKTPHTAVKFDLEQLKLLPNTEDDSQLNVAGPVQWVACSFKETESQREFRVSLLEKDWKRLISVNWIAIFFFAVLVCIYLGTFIITGSHWSIAQIIYRFFGIFLMMAMIWKFKETYKMPLFPWAIMMIYINQSLISAISLSSLSDEFIYLVVVEFMFINVVINHISGLLFGFILISSTVNFTIWLCFVLLNDHQLSKAIEATFFILAFSVINLFASYSMEQQSRHIYNLYKYTQRDIKNTEKLLHQMIPPQVVRNLQHDIATTDRYSDVSIIYADIAGFTAYSKNKEPIEVITMLSKLFSTFDHLCVRHNVYKVHTIGDCYVILSFTDAEKRDPIKECISMVEIALDMVKTINKVNKSKKTNLNMRIGIHTGEIIAGITGTNIVRYDVYGTDNDIANKMESNGQTGKINVSEVTKGILENSQPGRFDYVYNKSVRHEPTNRSVDCYFIVPKSERDLVLDDD